MTRFDVTIKAIIFTIFIPGTVVIIIPWILSSIWNQQIELGILRIGGALLIGIGLFFYCYAVLAFLITGKGTPMIFFMKRISKFFGLEPSTLVQTGPYRYSRNPMYLGVIITIFGEGLLFQLPIIILWSLISFALFHLVVCYLEEPHLRKKHKEEYENYIKRAPRWFGIPKPEK